MQKFSYHTHTNSFDLFDGRNSAKEMIKKAEEIGYVELGISNHICCHHNYPQFSPMFFNDYQQAEDVYKRVMEEIKTEALSSKIKIYVGFEVDYFPDLIWQRHFEKMIEHLQPDYLIGSTHTLYESDFDKIYHLYDKNKLAAEKIKELLPNYWRNVVATIQSGYFDIIGHIDLLKIFGLCCGPEWRESKQMVIEALASAKQVYELNTSGWRKAGEQHPERWMLEELNRRNVPVVISDDAHSTEMLAQYFPEAETLLESLSYKKRWSMNLKSSK